MQSEESQLRLSALESHANWAQRTVVALKAAVSGLQLRVSRIELKMAASSFVGSSLGASFILGAYLAWQHLTKGAP